MFLCLECTTTTYEISASASDFIESNYVKNLKQNTFVKDKYPNITESELEKMLVSFDVYFSSLSYKVIAQNPSTNWDDLIAGLGGTLGLFVSVSFFTLLEIGEIFILLLFSLFRSWISKQKISSPPL